MTESQKVRNLCKRTILKNAKKRIRKVERQERKKKGKKNEQRPSSS